jgi:hypothetical protein
MPHVRQIVAVALPAALASFALAGCYAYTAVPVESAPVGADVRARISAAEAERLRDVLGGEDRTLNGRLEERQDSGAILMTVATVPRYDGVALERGRQRILVPREGLVTLEMRRLDRRKTIGVIAVAAAAATYVVVNQFGTEKAQSGTNRGNPERRVARPIVRLPIARF